MADLMGAGSACSCLFYGGKIMACKNTCKLCKKLIISTAVNFDATDNALLINLPAGTYSDNCKYCIVVAQSIPTTTTINSLVFITIGTGTQRYPLVKRNCAQVTACAIRTRTKYSTCVDTNTVSGVFRLLGDTCCEPDNTLTGLNGTAPTTTVTPAPATA